MKLAQLTENGRVLELRWMWLPTFISQNYGLMTEMARAWKEQYPEGLPNLEFGISQAENIAHEWSIKWISERINIKGLDQYLRALEHVEEG